MSEISTFTSATWERIPADKKAYWPTLYVPSNSPLLNPAPRPFVTENTRASAQWAYLRDTLSSGTVQAGRLLIELREADRRVSENPNEIKAYLRLHHADATSALDATGKELRLLDAAARGDLEPDDVPEWFKQDATAAGMLPPVSPTGGTDPRLGQLGTGMDLERPRGYALILTGKGATEAEARVLASALKWARTQNAIGSLDPATVRADFNRMKPVPQWDRVGPSVGIVASRYYPPGPALEDFVRTLPREIPIIITGKVGDRDTQTTARIATIAREIGRTVINAEVTHSPDVNQPHDLKTTTDLGHPMFLSTNDYKNALVILNTSPGKSFTSTQIMVHHKLVDMSRSVVTFDDGRGDWGVRQANSLAIGAGKLVGSFDRSGAGTLIEKVAELDRTYLKTSADRLEEKIPRALNLHSPEAVLMLATIPGMRKDYIIALQARFDTIDEMRRAEYRSLPLPPELREKFRDANTYIVAGAKAADQAARARAEGIEILTFNDPKYPGRLADALDQTPPVLFVRGDIPALEGSVGLVGTVSNLGPAPLQTRDAIENRLLDGEHVRLTNGIALRPSYKAGEGGRIEVIPPEIGYAAVRANLKNLGVEFVTSQGKEHFYLGYNDIRDTLPALLPTSEPERDSISEHGKRLSALMGKELGANDATLITPLLPGAANFAIHGAALADGPILAIASTALDNINSPAMRDAANAVVNAGGAVISTTPLGSTAVDRPTAIEITGRIADALIVTEARRGDLSMLAVEAAQAAGKPVLVITPDARYAGAGIGGNVALLEGQGTDTIKMPSRPLLTNTTMWGVDEKLGNLSDGYTRPPERKKPTEIDSDRRISIEQEDGTLTARLLPPVPVERDGSRDPLPPGRSIQELDASLVGRRIPDHELSDEDRARQGRGNQQSRRNSSTPARQGIVSGTEITEGVRDSSIATAGAVTRTIAWTKPAIPIPASDIVAGVALSLAVAKGRTTDLPVFKSVGRQQPQVEKPLPEWDPIKQAHDLAARTPDDLLIRSARAGDGRGR